MYVFLRLCVMSWKDESEPNIKYFPGRQVGLVQEFITIQNFGHNWRRTDGIRVGIFSQGSPHCSSSTKSKSSCQKWAKSQNNLQDGSSSCRCSMTSHGDLKTMNRNVNLTPTSFLSMQKDFQQDVGHSSDLGQKKKWYSTYDRVADWMMIKFGESGPPSFPCHESTVPRNAQKQRRWKIINTLLRWWWNDWSCFSHNYFC